MGLGKLLYQYIFKPTLPIRYHIAHFGVLGWFKMAQGERHIKTAAQQEKPIRLNTAPDALTFCFLTGAKYWHQTVYAIKSLHLQIPGQFGVNIYSDGTLNATQLNYLQRFAEGMVYVSPAQVTERLEAILPKTQYPVLHYLRNWHPFFRRLIDIHTAPGWSIHLDSDMLFSQKPLALIQAFQNKQAVYMCDDIDDSYFVDDVQTLSAKHQIDCARNVNGGIIAYNNDLVDYADLEDKAKFLKDNYLHTGPARIEQTLMSYLLHKQNASGLAKDEYTIYFDSAFKKTGKEIVTHYIFKAKQPYFSSEWKKIR